MTDEPRKQEIAPCPMPGCGGECRQQHTLGTLSIWWVECRKCDYQSRVCDTEVEAIAAHNALCADVRRGREAEAIERERDALKDELAQAAQSRALLDATAQELRRENGVLRAEVERLRALLRDWDAACKGHCDTEAIAERVAEALR